MSLFIGNNLIWLESVDSTNLFAAKLAAEGCAEGTAVIAEEQTAGRGQMGTHWHATKGKNLTTSIVLRPTFLEAKCQWKLSQAVSLAIWDFLAGCLPDADTHLRIKWPNDLYWNHQKLGGILIENGLKGYHIGHSIVGIGLNINQLNYPAEICTKSTSLALVVGKVFELDALPSALFDCLERRYLSLRAAQHEALERDYLRVMYQRGEVFKYQHTATSEIFEGQISHTTPEGRIVISTASGSKEFGFKEVTYLCDTQTSHNQ